jgi:hypothetical protein
VQKQKYKMKTDLFWFQETNWKHLRPKFAASWRMTQISTGKKFDACHKILLQICLPDLFREGESPFLFNVAVQGISLELGFASCFGCPSKKLCRHFVHVGSRLKRSGIA